MCGIISFTKWERVVKLGSNLGGQKRNVAVIRNWPTFTFTYLINLSRRQRFIWEISVTGMT